MDWRNGFCGAAFGAGLLLSGAALAADEDLLNAPEITIEKEAASSGGIYLRGDIGYAPWRGEGDPYYRTFDAGTLSYDSVPFDNARFDKPFSGSLGVGYQFTDTFRADLTADYFEGRFSGSSASASPCAGQGAGTSCAFSTAADYSALGLMVNAYMDFGTLAGFTPYVGGGIGATRLNWDTAVESATCVAGGGACAGSPTAASYEGRDSWRFTYALMAGVSYDLSDQLKLDVGYRYSHIADGEMFGFGAEALVGATGDKGFDDGLSRHEIRAGLRFSF
ncbi:porin family protein [Ensifer adhaerens]|uniref:outer membrane protein n=1 Tax=Ensifer adhaerens TaxID=106592 RepID=UPI001CBD3AE0|nr:outer membrane protein [Ensifer adhaerens]MBZ7923166.1 porin family protein [Ensifer adhaerens]UAX91752.1 porin family protein [Ensifer adhaerens]UAX99380.1 porin family protein [Ensifer adhaerens]UAY06763.1 porin family protein [Ensifer adhaerens]